MAKKLTYEYVKSEIEKVGYKLLSQEYVNAGSKLEIECDKGHKYSVIWSSFIRGARCQYCNGRRKTIEDVKQYVSENAEGYQCLNHTYISSSKKLKFKCDKGHIYKADFSHFQMGRRCPICGIQKTADAKRLSFDYVKEKVNKSAPNYKLLSDSYFDCNTKLKFKCDKGHIYETTFTIFQTGCKCPYCAGVDKKDIDFIKKEVSKYGYQCLSDIYENNLTKLRIKCNKGHIYETTWAYLKAGNRCPKCIGRRLHVDYVRKEIEKTGYKLLDDKYINGGSKLNIQCDKGHTYISSWSKFKIGRRCPECAGKVKPTIEKIKEEVSKTAVGYKCLNSKYISSKTKLEFECDKGHKYKTLLSVFRNGSRCPVCAGNKKYTIERIHKIITKIAPNYKCCSVIYNGANSKLEFECGDGHRFRSTWHSFNKAGTRCPICSQKAATDKLRYTIDFVKNSIEELAPGYICISDIYENNLTPLTVKCCRDHTYKTTWGRFQSGNRCPKCAIEDNTKYSGIDELHEIELYRYCVWRITENNYKKYQKIINPYRFQRSYTKFHIDHIYSVADGFLNKIIPEIIANPTNLQMLPAFENQSKNHRSDITKEELFERYKNFIKQKKEN